MKEKTIRKIKKQVSGITLTALVVTIIVLLILAAVAINLTIGENGIITRAEKAKEEMIRAQREEELQMSYLGTMIGMYGASSEEELIINMIEMIKNLNIKGLYRLDGNINAENLKADFTIDCVREDNSNLYREKIEIDIEGEQINDIKITDSKKTNKIDNEALLPIILIESLLGGEKPEEIEIVSEKVCKFRNELYTVVMQNNEQATGIEFSFYIEKYTEDIPDDDDKPIITERPKLKDVAVGMSFAVGLGVDGKLYYWDIGNVREMPVNSTEIKEINGFDASSIDRIENRYLINEDENIIYKMIDPETYDTIRFEEIKLNERCIPKILEIDVILSQDGKLWDYEENCYNEQIPELKEVSFETMSEDLFLDTNKNVWTLNGDEAICLNNVENSPIQGIKINKISLDCMLGENGKIYYYNNNEGVIEIEIDKNVIDIHGTEYLLIFEDENNEAFYLYRDEINKLDIKTNIKNVYEMLLIDENSNLFSWDYSQEKITTSVVFENVENTKFIETSISYKAAIFIDEEYNVHEFGSFGIPL